MNKLSIRKGREKSHKCEDSEAHNCLFGIYWWTWKNKYLLKKTVEVGQ